MKTIKLSKKQLSKIIQDAWNDGCNAQANRSGYCIAVEQGLVDPKVHKFPEKERVYNRIKIYVKKQIKELFP
jgi:hypothetical protein